jgi:hypothetical protein
MWLKPSELESGRPFALSSVVSPQTVDWVVRSAIVLWTIPRLFLILGGVADGGVGDESHRLVFALRLTTDFWDHIYAYFFWNPWPVGPFVIQGLAFKALSALGLADQSDFIAVSLATSTVLLSLSALVLYHAVSAVSGRLAGVIAILLLAVSHSANLFGITAMAETYALFFVSLTLYFIATGRQTPVRVALGAVFLLLATLCRSEMVVLSGIFGVYLVFRRGWVSALGLVVVSTAAFAVKTAVNTLSGFSGMSYFTLKHFYRFEEGVLDNAGKAMTAARGWLSQEGAFSEIVVILAAFALAAFVLSTLRGKGVQPRGTPRLEARIALFASLFVAYTLFILMSMSFAFVLPWPRYFYFSQVLFIVPFACVVGAAASRMSETARAAFRDALRGGAGHARAGRLAYIVVAAAVMAAVLWQTASVSASATASIYAEQKGRIPPELREARDWLVANVKDGESVLIDALWFWETYLFLHLLNTGKTGPLFMVYDPPPGDWNRTRHQVPEGEKYAYIAHRYLAAFRPAYVVLTGAAWWQSLRTMQNFYDPNEKPSYLRPYMSESADGGGAILDSPYWLQNEPRQVVLTRVFANEKVAVYRTVFDFTNADLLAETAPTGVTLNGMSPITQRDGQRSRWGLGPETQIAFWSAGNRGMELRFRLLNNIPGQGVLILVNGVEVVRLSGLEGRPGSELWVSRTIQFKSVAGRNEIRFIYGDWNGKERLYFLKDGRPIAVNFFELGIHLS